MRFSALWFAPHARFVVGFATRTTPHEIRAQARAGRVSRALRTEVAGCLSRARGKAVKQNLVCAVDSSSEIEARSLAASMHETRSPARSTCARSSDVMMSSSWCVTFRTGSCRLQARCDGRRRDHDRCRWLVGPSLRRRTVADIATAAGIALPAGMDADFALKTFTLRLPSGAF